DHLEVGHTLPHCHHRRGPDQPTEIHERYVGRRMKPRQPRHRLAQARGSARDEIARIPAEYLRETLLVQPHFGNYKYPNLPRVPSMHLSHPPWRAPPNPECRAYPYSTRARPSTRTGRFGVDRGGSITQRGTWLAGQLIQRPVPRVAKSDSHRDDGQAADPLRDAVAVE